MSLENNLNNTNYNNSVNPHHHYKRVIIAIAVFIIIALVVAFGYYYFSSKKAMVAQQEQQELQRQAELVQDAQNYFAEIPPRTKEAADQDQKASIEFFKTLPTQ